MGAFDVYLGEMGVCAASAMRKKRMVMRRKRWRSEKCLKTVGR